MSRTYRFRRSKWLIKESGVLSDWIISDCYRRITKIYINSNSKEGIKLISRFISDGKIGFYNGIGPGWFHNITQRKYRTRVRKELSLFHKDYDYEIQLLRKPYREYWD